jgi:hypothetical protein
VNQLNDAPAGVEGVRLAQHGGARTGLAFLNSNLLSRCAAAHGRDGCRYCRAFGDGVPVLTYMCNAEHFMEHAACSSKEKESLTKTGGSQERCRDLGACEVRPIGSRGQ